MQYQVCQSMSSKMGLKVFIVLEEIPVRKRIEKGQKGWESCHSIDKCKSAPE